MLLTPDPQPPFDYVVRELASMNLAIYIHIIEGATGGPACRQIGCLTTPP
jgi:hypothetical protein